MMETWNISGVTLEYYDDTHTYIADGIIVPSVTQILKAKFGNKYEHVSRATLESAAAKGTEVHRAIELYCKTGEESELKELRNFKFLQRKYGFTVASNEIPVILFDEWGGNPIAAGRLDMLILEQDRYGIADIKRTAALDKNYLAYQLNLYRIAYMQSYMESGIEFLRGIHLREDTRKYVDIPINEEAAREIVNLYMEENND